MRPFDRIANRVAYERRRRTIRGFHRLYYESPWQTWKNTRWLSVNAYKTPLDLWIYQELIVSLRPQLIVETGTAFGGSALFLATVCDAVDCGEIVSIDSERRVGRPTHDRVTYITGSSTSPETLDVVAEYAKGKAPVLVILDSDHSREHVLNELRHYSDFVTPGSYLVVEDTNLNGHPVVADFGPGPMEAVREFLHERSEFRADAEQEKFFMSFNPSGYLRRVSPRVSPGNPHRAPAQTHVRHSRRPRTATVQRRQVLRGFAAAMGMSVLLFVGLPEVLGDRPYDPEPSTWPRKADHILDGTHDPELAGSPARLDGDAYLVGQLA